MRVETLLSFVICGLCLVIGLQVTTLYRQEIVKSASAERDLATSPPLIDATVGSLLNLNDFVVQGSEGARVIVVGFTDFECPYCMRHATTVLPELRRAYVETGRVRYAFAHYPLAIHANAHRLAIWAMCGASQGEFWPVHDALFEKRPRSSADILSIAKEFRLDIAQFQRCIEDDQNTDTLTKIKKNVSSAEVLGLRGTPSFAIGTADGSRIKVVKLLAGAVSKETFDRALSTVLNGL